MIRKLEIYCQAMQVEQQFFMIMQTRRYINAPNHLESTIYNYIQVFSIIFMLYAEIHGQLKFQGLNQQHCDVMSIQMTVMMLCRMWWRQFIRLLSRKLSRRTRSWMISTKVWWEGPSMICTRNPSQWPCQVCSKLCIKYTFQYWRTSSIHLGNIYLLCSHQQKSLCLIFSYWFFDNSFWTVSWVIAFNPSCIH